MVYHEDWGCSPGGPLCPVFHTGTSWGRNVCIFRAKTKFVDTNFIQGFAVLD